MNRLSISIDQAGYGEGESFYEPLSATYQGNQCLVLIGPGGSGKTTLLRLLSGKEHQSLWFEGAILSNHKSPFFIQQHYSEDQLLAFSEKEIDYLHGYWAGDPLILESIRHFNGDTYKNWPKAVRKIALFSKCQFQSDFHKSEMVLLDEPEAGLDTSLLEALAGKINELKNTKMVVVSTHHVAFTKMIADEVLFLKYGKLMSKLSKNDFFASDDFEVKYLIEMGC